MDIANLKEISKKFRDQLLAKQKYSLEELQEQDQKSTEKYANEPLADIFSKGYLSNFTGNPANGQNHYKEIAEMLLSSGVSEASLLGKEKLKNHNKLININGEEKVYSAVCITSLARRLALPSEIIDKQVKDTFADDFTFNVIPLLESLPFSETPDTDNKMIREKLFTFMQSCLEERPINIYFRDYEKNPLKLRIVDGKPKVFLEDEQVKDFNNLDIPGILQAIGNESEKGIFKRNVEKVKKAIISNAGVDLQHLCLGFLGPYSSSNRTTHRYNSYVELRFKAGDLKALDEAFRNLLNDLADDEFININNTAQRFYYKAAVDSSVSEAEITDMSETEPSIAEEDDLDEYPRNIIFFGPPGTGKSYKMKQEAININAKEENMVRVTFHPEYSYYDFVGQYKPVVGYETVTNKIEGNYGQVLMDDNSYKKPIVYYDFVPGPFTKAIIKALSLLKNNSKENVLLVIEEINRGNCAAIFGDIFQLLDRITDIDNPDFGYSEYHIDISDEMKHYIISKLDGDQEFWDKYFSKGFKLPKNLFIYATMNTSDQSLFPMDSAFKRRWAMEYIEIKYDDEKLKNIYLPEPYAEVKWADFIKAANKKIVEFTQTDDKQLGQWFLSVKSKSGERVTISKNDFLGKILSFLWFDIFRQEPSVFFKDDIKTYDDLKNQYGKKVIREEIIS